MSQRLGVRVVNSLFAIVAVSILAAAVASAQNVTTITVTDTPVRKDISRFGINLTGDNYYDAFLLKNRIHNGGFEGVQYRQLYLVAGGDGKSVWVDPNWKQWLDKVWKKSLIGAHYEIVTGAGKGMTGTITNATIESYPAMVARAKNPPKHPKEYTRLFLSNGGPSGINPYRGVMIVSWDSHTGYLGGLANPWVFAKGEGKITTEAGDVPPNSRGKYVAVLHAPGKSEAEISYSVMHAPGPRDGVWTVSFWAKGPGKVTMGWGIWHQSRKNPDVQVQQIPITSTWKHYEFKVDIRNYQRKALCLHLTASGGTVKLDDLACVMSSSNPTAFRDGVVQALKDLNVGTIRKLQMGGSTMVNWLSPASVREAYAPPHTVGPIRTNVWAAHPKRHGRADDYGIGAIELLNLCKAVGADPWLNTPGIIKPEEMAQLVEYLAGPADSPMGKLRASEGQVEPWTKVFKHIYIEFGNEAWNWSGPFNGRGYNGKGYWQELIAAGKSAKYFTPRIEFQIAGQAVVPSRNGNIAKNATNADGFAVGPYMLNRLPKEHASMSPEQLWGWAFGFPWYEATQPGGWMVGNYKEVTDKYHIPLSIYEVNASFGGGDLKTINNITTSIGGGINVANWMLLMLDRQGVKVQNFFNIKQDKYRKGIRLWGGVLDFTPDHLRYRPTAMGLKLVNQVLGGDLVAVQKSGADPTWHCTANYIHSKNGKRKSKPFDAPYIQAYAIKDGATRGLILFNFNIKEALPVRLVFPGQVASGTATKMSLVADKITDNNEKEHAPQVKIVTEPMPNLKSGMEMSLRPFGMIVLKWRQE